MSSASKRATSCFDINYQIRLVDSSQYDVADYATMKGFISGLYAGNYDITHVFIDSLCKIVPADGYNETENFLKWLNAFGERTASSSPSPSVTIQQG